MNELLMEAVIDEPLTSTQPLEADADLPRSEGDAEAPLADTETASETPAVEETRETDVTSSEEAPSANAVASTCEETDSLKKADDASPTTAKLLLEIDRLKAELSKCDAAALRLVHETEEFRALYPSIDPTELPDAVWKDVAKGTPIAAAYALFERRRYCIEQKATEYNLANEKRSAGSLEATEKDFYSPAEVRAMSQTEVRANYDKIMRSMQKWR